MLRIQLILIRIRIQVIFLNLQRFFNKAKFSNFLSYFFSLIFKLKLDEPFRNQEILIISLFSIVQIWVLRVIFFFLQFMVDILPLGSGSVGPNIFADPDPDPGSQNLADPMN